MLTDHEQTTINNFKVLNKLGKPSALKHVAGCGSFSDVFRVKRISDGLEYALKKVRKALV